MADGLNVTYTVAVDVNLVAIFVSIPNKVDDGAVALFTVVGVDDVTIVVDAVTHAVIPCVAAAMVCFYSFVGTVYVGAVGGK